MARLLDLPNELLIQISSSLPTTDLRFLSQANRWLYSFVKDYLNSYRYNKGFTRLPDNALLIIVDYLWPVRKRYKNFAQTSQRFFAIGMDRLVLENVVECGSSFLGYAAERGLVTLTRRMIAMGADVNRQQVGRYLPGRCSRYGQPWTCLAHKRVWSCPAHELPLSYAAHYGHEAIVRILLDAGADNSIIAYNYGGSYKHPLAYAIEGGHEDIALVLAQYGLYEIDETSKSALQMACEFRFSRLIRYLLSNPMPSTKKCMTRNLSTAMFWLLRQDINWQTEPIPRTLLEEQYQLVLLLLHHGADPDIFIPVYPYSQRVNARDMAALHPDPRVRSLMPIPAPRATPQLQICRTIPRTSVSSTTIGRTGYVSTARATADILGYQDEDMFSPWDYSDDELSSETSTQHDDEGDETSSTSDCAADCAESHEAHLQVQRSARLEKQLDVPETLSFPSLSPKAKQILDFWTRKPDNVLLTHDKWSGLS